MSNETDSAVIALDESTRRYYLDVMGVQCWQLRDDAFKDESSPEMQQDELPQSEPRLADSSSLDSNAALSAEKNWPSLETAVQQCTACTMHKTRKQALLGNGSQSAQLMFVLLAPNSHDDESGVLCGGEERELFSKMLSAINLSIADVYITSLLKCCVPSVHTISPQEIQLCNDYLHQQIMLIKPEIIVVLGETTVRCLLQNSLSMDDFRALNSEAKYQIDSIPIFASYSPHELLQQTENKRKAWADLQQLQKRIG